MSKETELSDEQIDGYWDGLMPSGNGKSRYDIARFAVTFLSFLTAFYAGLTEFITVKIVTSDYCGQPSIKVLRSLESRSASCANSVYAVK